ITFSDNWGDSDESISRSLGAGTYYVRVYPYRTTGYDTRYRLELTATPTGIGDIANPVFNMGVLSGTQTFTDFVGSADSSDYYRFTLNEVKDFSLTLGGMTDNANVGLYLAEEQVDG
ncbi:serine protease, partial [Phormidium sp. CCY1219]|nr:serine protease [Phormidium sp. CCY1219]